MAANFLVYHKLGNVGFLGFSGAASFQDTKPYFQEAGSRKARTRSPRVEPKLKSSRDMNDIMKHTSTLMYSNDYNVCIIRSHLRRLATTS